MFVPLKHRKAQSFLLLPLVLLLFALALPGRAQIRDGGIDPHNLGKGDWVYFMSDATNKLGGNVASVTNENSLMLYYKSQGIRYFIVKAGTSDTFFNGTYGSPQFTAALCNTAHANGMLIFGYNRSYGSNIVGEIAISDYVFNQGADGFIWDAESESGSAWIGTTGPSKAWQLCSTVRSNWPNKFLAHSPFAIVSFHSSFPYKEFGYWCDAAMPQIYHFSSQVNLKGSMSASINWTDVNWNNWQNSLAGIPATNINGLMVYWTNSIKPLVPINDVYGPATGQSLAGGTGSPLPNKDVQEFIDYLAADPNPVTTGGYKGANFFRTDLHDTVQWANIQQGTLGIYSNVVNNIVMDDPASTKTGSWTSVRTFYNNGFFGGAVETNSFGTNYLFKAQGTGAAYVQFTPNIQSAGQYDVYEWHVQKTNASASVPVVINYNGGTITVPANQQVNSGIWNLLGRFSFAAGTSGNIRISDAIPESTAVAIADGIKLVYAPPAGPPVISAVSATPADVSAAITWATDVNSDSIVDYGTTTNYTDSATNSAQVTSHGISLANLTPSTTYHYRVKSQGTNSTQAVSGDFNFTTTPLGVVGDIIIDNPNANVVGAWSTGTSSADKYGADYLFRGQGAGANYVQYVPAIPATGLYQVFCWYPQGGNRTTNAPYQIDFNGGSQTIYVNQVGNGGKWNLLGQFNFVAGASGDVKITDGFPDAGKVVMADAIKFSFVPPPSITTQPADLTVKAGSNATFTVTASGGSALSYQWLFAGTNIGNATASNYTVVHAQATNAGAYAVVVTDLAGSTTSSNAQLTVTQPLPSHIDQFTVNALGQLQMNMTGDPGSTYVIEVTTNFASWLPVATNYNTNGTFQFAGNINSNAPASYYRLRLGP